MFSSTSTTTVPAHHLFYGDAKQLPFTPSVPPNVPSTPSHPHLCVLSSEVSVCQKTSSLSHDGLVCTLKRQERGHREAPASAAVSPVWPTSGSPGHSHRFSPGQKTSTKGHSPQLPPSHPRCPRALPASFPAWPEPLAPQGSSTFRVVLVELVGGLLPVLYPLLQGVDQALHEGAAATEKGTGEPQRGGFPWPGPRRAAEQLPLFLKQPQEEGNEETSSQ